MFRTIWVFTKQTWRGYTRNNCSQMAAAISYYTLFSIIPLLILAVSILGFVIVDDSRRAEVVDGILDALPLTQTEGRDVVTDALDTVQRSRAPLALLSLGVALWSGSAMFGSVRNALNVVWRLEEPRPFFRAKLIDLAQIGVLGALLLASLTLTAVLRIARELSADFIGPLANASPLWELPPILVPALLTFAVFTLLYHIVPAAHPSWRNIVPGALLATILFEALKNGFAIYVANFNNYDVVYGSLAAALLFLLFVYLASNIFLLGAELAHVFERYHAGALDAEIHPPVPGDPLTTQAFRALKGLFVRE